MGYYYHSQQAQDSKDVNEAKARIESGENPNTVKADYRPEISGAINLAVEPPHNYVSPTYSPSNVNVGEMMPAQAKAYNAEQKAKQDQVNTAIAETLKSGKEYSSIGVYDISEGVNKPKLQVQLGEKELSSYNESVRKQNTESTKVYTPSEAQAEAIRQTPQTIKNYSQEVQSYKEWLLLPPEERILTQAQGESQVGQIYLQQSINQPSKIIQTKEEEKHNLFSDYKAGGIIGVWEGFKETIDISLAKKQAELEVMGSKISEARGINNKPNVLAEGLFFPTYEGFRIFKGISTAMTRPIETISQPIFIIGQSLDISNYPKGQIIPSPLKSIYSSFKAEPVTFIIEQAGTSLFLGKAIDSGVVMAKEVYVRAGSSYIKPEMIWSSKVMEGKSNFPLASSVEESLKSFNVGEIKYNIQLAKQIEKQPESFISTTATPKVNIDNPVFKDVTNALQGEDLLFTGGVARKVLTGEGNIRDIDIITNEPKRLAEKVAEKYPDKYKVIQHEKYPEIYRLREKQSGKVIVDFDPYNMAEEGLVTPKTYTQIEGIKFVSPEIMVKSKATQIIKGKATTSKQGENIEQLSGKKLDLFEKKIEVITTSPAKIKGDIVEAGRKGQYELEDSGIFVSPMGEGSPAFLRLSNELGTEYTLNPFEGLFDIPTATTFKVNAVVQYPREVISQGGFKAVSEYAKSRSSKAEAYITKRSEIGQGNIKAQEFVIEQDFPLPMKGLTVKREGSYIQLKEGELVKKGDIVLEAGTSEKEAIVGESTKFQYQPKTIIGKIKGFDEYTTYKGRAVPIRRTNIIEEEIITPKDISLVKNKKEEGQIISSQQIEKETMLRPKTESIKPILNLDIISKQINPNDIIESRPVITSSIPMSMVSFSSPINSIPSRVSEPIETYSFVSQPSKVSTPINSIVVSESKPSEPKEIYSFVSEPYKGSSPITSSPSRVSEPIETYSFVSQPSKVSTPYYQSNIINEPPIKKNMPLSALSLLNNKKRKVLYRVLVRRGGIFKQVAVESNPQLAFRIGKQAVSTTAAASFKVVPTEGKLNLNIAAQELSPVQFYQSRKEAGVFIERPEKRIKSAGEKREITQKGLEAIKLKKVF